MPIPVISQDLIKGIDFTTLSPQTAAEHNQLVDASIPYTDGSEEAEGIGFLISTTDTALDTPSVPNPEQASDFNKWKRYLWNRRPFGIPDPFIPKLYQWADVVTSDATYLKWVLVDSASYTTVGGGAGTNLQTAIDQINTDAANALAAANSATASVTQILTNIGTVVGSDLQTQVTAVTNAAATNTSDITLINTAIGGSTGLTGPGGINGSITSIQAQLSTGLSQQIPVTQIIPSPISFARPRTNSGSTALEWADPASTFDSVLKSTATGTITFPAGATTPIVLTGSVNVVPGTYIVMASFGGLITQVSANATGVYCSLNVIVGSQTLSGPTSGAASTGGGKPNVSITLNVLSFVTITVASGTQALSAAVVVPANCNIETSNLYLTVCLVRI